MYQYLLDPGAGGGRRREQKGEYEDEQDPCEEDGGEGLVVQVVAALLPFGPVVQEAAEGLGDGRVGAEAVFGMGEELRLLQQAVEEHEAEEGGEEGQAVPTREKNFLLLK